jgi:hypothetical protein
MPLFRRKRDPENLALAERLDSLGFFKYAEDPTAAKAEFERRGKDAFWRAEHGRDVLFADAEDLAEGGIAAALNELQPKLAQMGVLLEDDVENDFGEDRYVVRIAGREYLIHDVDTVESSWGLAMARTFRIVNDLLEDAGSPERAYAVYEQDLWFLTPELFDAVTDVLGESRSRPYVPTEEPPRYGEPSGAD